MKKKLSITFLCILLTAITLMCGYTNDIIDLIGKISFDYSDIATADTATHDTAVSFASGNSMLMQQGEIRFLALSEEENENFIKWESSDNDIAEIDCGGRVDAISPGEATITGYFKNDKKSKYKVFVTSAEKKEIDKFSTCNTANEDVVAKNKNNKNNKNLYEIRVNRNQNCVTVYTYDDRGYYNVPVRAMVCSTGLDNSTITGNYKLYFKHEWHDLFDDVYGYYVSGISGDYLFHSVPYYSKSSDTLKTDEFNKLGKQASMGCVRLSVSDAKWIYKNCKEGTLVTIYDDYSPGPLGKPKTIKIKDKDCGWDPTDDNPNNPYYDKSPIIKGANDFTLKVGGEFFPMADVSATDTCSNDISKKVTVTGNVVTTRKGTYKLTYSVTDNLHRTTSIDVKITVQ